jgi:peroxiredoxin
MYRLNLTLLCLLFSSCLLAQSNFTYTPEKPRPGDRITVTYEPAGALTGVVKPIRASYYVQDQYRTTAADDIPLTRQGKKWVGSFTTDTAANFVFFGFEADKQFDNNFNKGYYILLQKAEKPARGAYASLASFYNYAGNNVGVDNSAEKALTAIQEEIRLYPSESGGMLPNYVQLIRSTKKEEAPALIQKEIEAYLKKGLNTEKDYEILEVVYNTARLPEQAKLVSALRKAKYPAGTWLIDEQVRLFYNERDIQKSSARLATIEEKVRTDKDWKRLEGNLPNYRYSHLFLYQRKKDWKGFEQASAAATLPASQLANLYNEAAWTMQADSSELSLAKSFSAKAVDYARRQLKQPTEPKPAYLTTTSWNEERKFSFSQYADTYAMVLYRMGDYKNAYASAREAVDLTGRSDANHNNTYALVAERALPVKQYRKELEDLVRTGKAGAEVKAVLQRAYRREKGSDEGFDNYILALQREELLNMVAALRKSMLTEKAPSFALLDLDGKKISLADLKGKVVVADFWATWCGPCIASFPGMQKAVEKFRSNPEVQFVFIDTWESGDEQEKRARKFMTDKKYSFQVLMDNENKVVEQFGVQGIPTKFVIDKNGVIRFRSVGFGGDPDKLVAELTAMIELAASDGKAAAGKTF